MITFKVRLRMSRGRRYSRILTKSGKNLHLTSFGEYEFAGFNYIDSYFKGKEPSIKGIAFPLNAVQFYFLPLSFHTLHNLQFVGRAVEV
jgi:hypothetical protein